MENWNLLLIKTGAKSYDVIMPDNIGNLPLAPGGADGFRVQWPVNPHFTGISMILDLLKTYAGFETCKFTERKAVQA
jgi:hypothetical protein